MKSLSDDHVLRLCIVPSAEDYFENLFTEVVHPLNKETSSSVIPALSDKKAASAQSSRKNRA